MSSDEDRFPAEYLGGHPAAVSPGAGGIEVGPGGLRFHTMSLGHALQPASDGETLFTIAAEDIVAAQTGSPDRVRQIVSGMRGYMLGGAIGGLIGLSGSASQVLIVALADGTDRATAAFGLAPDDARAALWAVQQAHRSRTGEPLPTVEEVASDEQMGILVEIRDLLREQNRLLGRLLGDASRDDA